MMSWAELKGLGIHILLFATELVQSLSPIDQSTNNNLQMPPSRTIMFDFSSDS
jgi:hypothetical protein